MNEAQALSIVTDYFNSHGFSSERIDHKKIDTGKKSPDLKVSRNNLTAFYCEVKSPLHLVNEITQMFHWTTSVSKLRGFIHKAVKQFKDYDNNHLIPWAISFTSDHFQLNWTNFIHALQRVVSYDSKIIRDLRKERYVVDTIEDIKNIDMYIWNQINSKDNRIYQIKIILNKNLPLFSQTEKISNLLIARAEEKINFLAIDKVAL